MEEKITELKKGVAKYQTIMKMFNDRSINILLDKNFQRIYKGFYITAPMSEGWAIEYFRLFDQHRNTKTTYGDLLTSFSSSVQRSDASFISKMYATIDPNQVIIDSIVLEYFGLGLKNNGSLVEKVNHAIKIFNILTKNMNELLSSEKGKKAIQFFDKLIPDSGISDMKKLDFLIYSKLIDSID